MLVVEDLDGLSEYHFNNSLRRYQWVSGNLSNGGESVELTRPGPFRDTGGRTNVRVDRVKYDDDSPWPSNADGEGSALRRIVENGYGNDFANWTGEAPSPHYPPAGGSFPQWASERGGLLAGGDPDGDGIFNLLEYALGFDPNIPNHEPPYSFGKRGQSIELGLGVSMDIPDVNLYLESSEDMVTWREVYMAPVEIIGRIQRSELSFPVGEGSFFRLKAELKP